MKIQIFILLSSFLISLIGGSQITFDKRYDKEISLNGGKNLFELTDRYIVTGSWGDFSQTDTLHPMFLVVDKEGNVVSNQTYVNNVCDFEIAGYQKTNQNDFIGVGGTNTPGDTCGAGPNPYPIRKRFYLHKIDKNGNLKWKRNYGGTLYNSNNIGGADIVKTNDGNYLVFGEKEFRTYIIKINNSGDTLWTNKIITNSIYMKCKIEPVQNGYLCFLSADTYGTIIKINEQGELLWSRLFNNTKLCEVSRTKDNGFIIVSDVENMENIPKTRLTKIDQNANIVWQKTFDELLAYFTVTQTSDGNFVVGYKDIAKVDSSGHILWQKRLIKDNSFFFYNDIIETSDGGLLITGRSKDLQVILTKTDCRGNLDWDTTACPIITDDNLKIYPNPFKDEITIVLPKNSYKGQTTISLFNIQGQKVKKLSFNDQQVLKINTTNLASGLYMYKINLDEKIIKTGKILRQ